MTNVQSSDSQALCKRLDIPQIDAVFSDGTIIIPPVVLVMGSITLQIVPNAIRLEITNLNRTLVILISKSHSFSVPTSECTLPRFLRSFFTNPHRRNLGYNEGKCPANNFFLSKNSFYLAIALRRGK